MAAAMVGIEWDAPPGHIKLALGDGHQAIQKIECRRTIEVGSGRARWCGLIDIERFAAECVNPPPGIKALDWIKGGMAGAKWDVGVLFTSPLEGEVDARSASERGSLRKLRR